MEERGCDVIGRVAPALVGDAFTGEDEDGAAVAGKATTGEGAWLCVRVCKCACVSGVDTKDITDDEEEEDVTQVEKELEVDEVERAVFCSIVASGCRFSSANSERTIFASSMH